MLAIMKTGARHGNHPGTPFVPHAGIVCTEESFKQVVKLTFAPGVSLDDPKELFNFSPKGTPGA